MQLLLWFFSQLLSYGVLAWFAFAVVAFCAARFGGLLGMFGGHVAIAVLVVLLDIRWVDAAMAAPSWDGSPDLDVVFVFGSLVRIVLINTLLLAISIPALHRWQMSRTVTHHPAA